MSNKDLSMALIITIGFVLVMSLANSQEIEEQFTQNNKEGFSDFDSIREFYEEEEEFENPPENSPEQDTFEDGSEEDEEQFEASPNEEDEEQFEASPNEEDEEQFEGFPDNSASVLGNNVTKTEKFTPYEKHLQSVVSKYKFNN